MFESQKRRAISVDRCTAESSSSALIKARFTKNISPHSA
jgi:hypothetical protein